MEWTPILTALIAAAAALAGLVVGNRIEEHRSIEARKARQEERDWQRNERKRQELTELQQALGDHVVRVSDLVNDELVKHKAGRRPYQALNAYFVRDLYDSQLRTVFLATRTADDVVYAAVTDVIGACEAVIDAKSSEDAESAIGAMTRSLGRADKLIFEHLRAFDSSPALVP